MDPLTWAMLRFGPRWLLVLILLSILFWGFVLAFVIRAWRKSRVALRHKVLAREPGTLYCPEDASALAKGENAKGVAYAACPSCSGKWTTSERVAAWQPLPPSAGPVETLPCPSCSKPLEGGHLLGQSFTVRRCAACGGHWMSRIDWVSFELGL